MIAEIKSTNNYNKGKVYSNDSGEVFGVMPSKELWRININDSTKVINIKSSGFLFIKNCG
jgi:uncharacterized protein YqkB